MATYTVKKGDCLWTISQEKLGTGSRWTEIATLNNISKSNPTIYPGQVLTLPSGSGGTSGAAKKNASRATIEFFSIQAGTDATVFATWKWDRDNTDSYKVKWYYATGDGVGFLGGEGTSNIKQYVFTAPSNATHVSFYVKPISKKKKVNKKEVSYWTAAWSTKVEYWFKNNPPSKPSTPKVEIKDYKLTAELSNLQEINATHIEFQIVKDNKSVFNSGKAKIVTWQASYSCKVNAGSEYKVRCRAIRGKKHSDWSEYSDNLATIPSTVSKITSCKASSETSVYLAWSAVKTATSYDIEYTTKKEYFDGSDKTTTATGIEFTHYEKTGLETGQEYFFRVRAVNSVGHSGWSGIKSVVIGKEPAAPTTWSSATTVITGEPLILYWVHNAQDESSQTYGELEMYVDGVKETHTIKNTTDEDEKDKTSFYSVDTSKYIEGTKIQWRVRTSGVTKVFGDWSIQRTVDIYAPPTLQLNIIDLEGEDVQTITSFPFYVYGLAGPNTQSPIGYHLTITANESYETADQIGNEKTISAGDQVYSKHFDTNDALLVELSANNLDLENNIEYTISCVASMNSGLTAEASTEISVAWGEEGYTPNAEIGVDPDTLTASISPYCEDDDGNLAEDITLSVYRREFDGSFTELATGLENVRNTYITDPHPALDYARYRIVAITKTTGAVNYYDVPGYPVGETAVIIQWAEEWSSFDVSSDNEDALEKPPWAGSLLKLPYNIDVSDKTNADVSLVEYIGRKHPVSYYGTQVGETSSWNVVIEKDDEETLYNLRRLSKWMGDVYVREPSGTGYWANIKVSYSQKHREVTIAVTLELTRVEGGI